MAGLSLNQVLLMGNLTGEPELKQTPGGLSVCNFTLAVNRKFGKQGDQSVDFINVVAWRQSADYVGRYLHKGSAIYVRGQIQTRNYTNSQGQKVYITEILAEEVASIGNKSENSGNGNNYRSNDYAPTAYGGSNNGFEELGDSDSSLPF